MTACVARPQGRCCPETNTLGNRLPATLDRRELAEFVLTTMEGGVMQARTHRDVGYFDRAVRQLRAYFDHLEHDASRARRPSKRVPGGRKP